MAKLKEELISCLTHETILKLKKINISTVIDFISSNPEEISRLSSVPFTDVLAIRKVMLAQYSAFPQVGSDVYDDVISTVAILPTGCPSLDKLLEEGIYTSEVTEITGCVGVGKTQFCLNIAAAVALDTGQGVIFIDTCGSFDPGRIHDILINKTKDLKKVKECLEHIQCWKAFSIFELLSSFESLKTKLNAQNEPFFSNVKLVIVDSIASVASPILGGQQTDGHSYLLHVARALKTLAVEYGLAVVVVNNSFGDGKPALGRAWSHIPSCRVDVQMTKDDTDDGGKRTATLTKSTRQATGSTVDFWIFDGGLIDKNS